MREGGGRAEAGPASTGLAADNQSSCSGARVRAAACAFPLRRDQRRRPSPRPKDTELRGPPQPAPLGASARRALG